MSLISMHGAWLSFSDAPLLDNAELHIEDNERVCLVGRNGAGKSTLMKILNREQGLDDGRIIYEQDLVVARLQQDPPRNVQGSVYDFVAEGIAEQAVYLKRYHDISHLVIADPSDKNLQELAKVQEQLDHHNLWQLENRINEVLEQLGLEADMELASLSGGWLRKAALGRALVSNPRVLLLDEPTNHLDIETIDWLEGFLKTFNGTIIFISHDRSFIRNMATRIVDLDRGKLVTYPGDYDTYLLEKEENLRVEELQGEDLAGLSIKERADKIGYVMQDPNQMISQTMIFDEVALGLRLRKVPEDEVKERVGKVLKICGLYPFRNWPVSALSFGQKKRVTIAAILVLEPDLLILDEPTAGQDWKTYTEIMSFLKELNEAGKTIMIITHDMHLMMEYTDRSFVFKRN